MKEAATNERSSKTAWLGGMSGQGLLLLLLSASIVMNVALSREVSSLRGDVNRLSQERSLRVGARVPAIEGLGLDGSSKTLRFNDVSVPTVIYFFTPQCGWCKKNLPNLHALIDNSKAKYRIVGVSLTSKELLEYVNREHLSSLLILSEPVNGVKEAYHLGVTPQTVVVSPDGHVLKVWFGVYQDPLKNDIESYLNLRLPGCCAVTGS